MASPPTILKLTIPPIIDISKGAQDIEFSVQMALGDSGLHVRDVTLTLEGAAFSLSFAYAAKVLDSFDDDTPTSARVAFHFDGKTPPGTYPILRLSISDTSGLASIYTAAQLKALGWPTEYTVINSSMPIAPTISVQADASGLIDGDEVIVSGTAAPGSSIDVSARFLERVDNADSAHTVKLGSTQTDANGYWSLTSTTLKDGRYVDLKATATVSGNSSPFSVSKEFKVSAVVPATPQVRVILDSNGNSDTATPYVTGFTTAGAVVKVFDHDTLVATSIADSAGWFGTRTAVLDAGAHVLTAIASNLSGGASSASTALPLEVDAKATTGIRFDVETFTNESSFIIDQQVLKDMLADVGAILSSFIDGNQRIALKVDVAADPANKSWAYASAGASRAVIDPTKDMPVLSNANLTLSYAFAKDLIELPHEKMRLYIDVLVHEMLHVLGFNTTRDPFTYASNPNDFQFGQLSSIIDGDLYFVGAYATAANGGPVKQINPGHLAEPDDVMHHSTPIKFSDVSFFGSENPTMPLTAVDLAILKDLGYTIKNTIVSRDGHTFIAGSGKDGYDQVDGTPEVDTFFINEARNTFDGTWTDGEYLLSQRSAPREYYLDGIERIRFADSMFAIDVDGAAGQVYRLYQAVFGRTPDSTGLGFWISHVDNGLLLAKAADAFVASAEFKRLYGEAPTSDEIVTKLYTNVLHRVPDKDGFDFWSAVIQKNPALVEEVLVAFSESPENKTQVAKIIGNGFEYEPYG